MCGLDFSLRNPGSALVRKEIFLWIDNTICHRLKKNIDGVMDCIAIISDGQGDCADD